MIDTSIPLIDLHRHLDGNVRLETIIDLGMKHNLPLPAWEIEELRPYVQIVEPQPGVMAFIEKFKWLVGVLADYDACRRVAYENVQDAHAEGIDYIELRFSPVFMALPHQLDPTKVVEAVVDGVERGMRETGLKTNLIGIISRTYGVESGMVELEALLDHREEIIAIDLAGDEINWPGVNFIDHFEKGRAAGWHVTVHAGESAGPESVWQALKELGATRIGHGVHAMEDEGLINYLREHEIGVEVNLTSNVQTMIVKSYETHPIKEMLQRGLRVTLNTDDPGVSNIDLPHEYNVAAPKAGLTQEDITQVQKNAVAVAFLTEYEKQELWSNKGL
jgi:adenosine deaminase